jgi:hypothetical protein
MLRQAESDVDVLRKGRIFHVFSKHGDISNVSVTWHKNKAQFPVTNKGK